MTESVTEYERHFLPQQLVRVAFPSSLVKRMDVQARAAGLTRDLLELELEEDRLPMEINIALGDVLELRSGREGSGFRCRALLISGTDSRYLLVRLVGSVIYEELREFFRIDTYLPLRYTPMPGWDEKSARRKWLEVTENRLRSARLPASFIYQGEPPDSTGQTSEPSPPIELDPPIAANISGGGLRTTISQELVAGSYALLELYLPGSTPRIIDVAGEVLSSDPESLHHEQTAYSTAFKFTCIDERDRDTLISYIQSVQQKQIHQLAEEMPAMARYQEELAAEMTSRKQHPLQRRISTAFFLLILFLIIFAYTRYYLHPSKGEIQLIFEQGLKKYLEKLPSHEHRPE